MRRLCVLLFLTLPGLFADDITLRTGEKISAPDYNLNPLYATVGKRSIPRSSIQSIDRSGSPSGNTPPADTVVLSTGERLTGHVLFASPAEVQLDNRRIPSKDVSQILFSTGKPGDWAIEISSSGGFTGHGGPHVIATSFGYANTAEINLPRGEDRSIPPDILHNIDAVVRAGKPSDWKTSYVPPGDNGCCDRLQETFSLQVDGPDRKWIVYRTSWFSGNQDRFPVDLKAIIAIVMSNQKNFTKLSK